MKLVILDRDGVINVESPEYIKSPAEWIPIPGSLQAIARLTRAQYKVAIATNQSGINRGLYTHTMLESIHRKMHNALSKEGGKIDMIAYCPHHPDDACSCRKPKPGLLLQISEQFNYPLQGVPFIGDRGTDVKAALAVDAKPILIGKYAKKVAAEFSQPIMTFTDLNAAVTAILESPHAENHDTNSVSNARNNDDKNA